MNMDLLRKQGLPTQPNYKLSNRWSDQESKELKNSVRIQIQKVLVERKRDEFIKKSLYDSDDYLKEMSNIKNMSDRDLELSNVPIDWNLVAKGLNKGERTGIECKIRWYSHESALINKSENWTAEEDQRLLELATLHQERNWSLITEQLNTGRSVSQCFIHYQRDLNKKLLKSQWNEEEDALLKEALQIYGEKDWQSGRLLLF